MNTSLNLRNPSPPNPLQLFKLLQQFLRSLDNPSVWTVSCTLFRQEDYGRLSAVTTTRHWARSESRAKAKAIKHALRQRPNYTLATVTASPVGRPSWSDPAAADRRGGEDETLRRGMMEQTIDLPTQERRLVPPVPHLG